MTTVAESNLSQETWFKELQDRISCLPGRVAMIVNPEFPNLSIIEIPELYSALRERMENPPFSLRKGWVVSSGDMPKVGECWLTMPNEGQWWSPSEVKDLFDIEIPSEYQLRFYGAYQTLWDQIVCRYCN